LEHASGCDVDLVGARHLAAQAERHVRGRPIDEALIQDEIAPAFVDAGGRRTDRIVLACTHFPLLIDVLARLAPWPVTFVDPGPAIARRSRSR
jgi:glutamate racemase